MAWVRAQRRVSGWLALFALALQLVLSFGHVHAGDFAVPGAAQAQAVAPAGDAPPDGDEHGDCAICATLHLNSVLLPDAPQPAEPLRTADGRFATSDAFDKTSEARFAFQARAPPQV